MEDVIRKLQTEEFPRLRLGIGPPPAAWDPADFVLARFSREELPVIEEAVSKAAEAVVVWIREGLTASMSRFN